MIKFVVRQVAVIIIFIIDAEILFKYKIIQFVYDYFLGWGGCKFYFGSILSFNDIKFRKRMKLSRVKSVKWNIFKTFLTAERFIDIFLVDFIFSTCYFVTLVMAP